jgi:hypothetical protein
MSVFDLPNWRATFAVLRPEPMSLYARKASKADVDSFGRRSYMSPYDSPSIGTTLSVTSERSVEIINPSSHCTAFQVG